MPDDREDRELVAAALQALPGDYRAFEDLIRRHQARIVNNCRILSGSADTAEDLAQEVFVKAFYAIQGFRGKSSFGTWLQRIKVNHCLDYLRRDRDRLHLDVDDPVLQSAESLIQPAAPVENPGSTARRVQTALALLSEAYRVPLVMCDADGYSYQEIADSLGLSLSATKMRIKRARERFRGAFDGDTGGKV